MQTSFDFNEYEIIEYKDIVTFENLLTNHGGYLKERKEQHLRFFNEYFKEIELKNILVEKNYIDKDYLEDYSAYFVRCFVEYPKNCVRLHFFNFVFNEGEIIKLILDGKNVEKYTDGYLGFMVIKPIPNKIIGKTCLATYRNIGKNIKSRYYPATRDYKIHLFGIQFDIKTLAYQEQDSILGACATTALWSAFQATSHLFNHAIPTPVTITKIANKKQAGNSRIIPNTNGLTPSQMADCIRAIGLEPLGVIPKDNDELKAIVYSYCKQMKIPIILGIDLHNIRSKKSEGLHAVTVCGFRTNPDNIIPKSFKSNEIDCLYVHDDQIGPFARMEFKKKKQEEEEQLRLTTSWREDDRDDDKISEYGKIEAIPNLVIIPLYHKVRITYVTIRDKVKSYNDFLNQVTPQQSLIWDIFLSKSTSLKEEVRKNESDDLTSPERIKILTKNLPRFIWRAIGFQNEKKIVEYVFDATGIGHEQIILHKIIYNFDHEALMISVIETDSNAVENANHETKEFLRLYKDVNQQLK